MSRDKSISVRFAAVGGQTVKAEMREIGAAGRVAMQDVAGSTGPANAGLDQLSAAAQQARAQLEAIAAKATATAASMRSTAQATTPLVDQINRLTGVTPAVGQSTASFLAQGQALDDLRAKYNPVFGVIRQYRQEVAEIRAVHLEGALSADEMAAAISRARSQALNSIAAYKGSAQQIGQMSRASRGATLRLQQMFFQVNDIGVSLAGGMNPFVVMAQQGTQIAQIYGFGNGGVSGALRDVGKLILGVVSRFPIVTAAIAAGTLAVAGMTREINKTSDVAVTFGDTALAVWQVIRDGIWSFIKPAVDKISEWFWWAWEQVVAGVKWVGNSIIQGIDILISGIRFGVESIPDLFRGAWEAVKGVVYGALADMLQGVNDFIQSVADGLNSTFNLNLSGPGGGMLDSLRKMQGEAEAASKKADASREARRQQMVKDMAATLATDPMGAFFDAVSGRAQENARNRLAEDDKKGGGRSKEKDEIDELIRSLEQELAVLRETDPVKKQMLEYSEKLAGATDLERSAVEALVTQLESAKNGWESVSIGLRQYAEEAMNVGKQVGDAIKNAFQGAEDAIINFAKTGKFEFKEFAASVIEDLLRIAVRSWILGPIAKTMGLSLGGGAPLENANGNAFDRGRVVPFATGGVVNRPTLFPMSGGSTGLMGEAGPEAIMPLTRVGGKLGVQAQGGGGVVSVRVFVDQDGNWRSAVEQISGSVSAQVVKGYDQTALPGRVKQIQSDERKR